MDHETDVRPIDSHAGRVRGHNDSGIPRHETFLNGFAVVHRQPRVIRNGVDAVAPQRAVSRLDIAARAGIDDSGSSPAAKIDNSAHLLRHCAYLADVEVEIG